MRLNNGEVLLHWPLAAHTITVGPLSAGDVATLKALCEQLQLAEMGLYKES